MLRNSFERLITQIQSRPVWITTFQFRHNAITLMIMIKPAVLHHTIVQHTLPRMTKRRMTKIVSKTNTLQPNLRSGQRPCQCATNLSDCERMSQSGTVVIT